MLKRYEIFTPPYSRGRMEEDSDGNWVRFDDVRELIDAAKSVMEWDWDVILSNVNEIDEESIIAIKKLEIAMKKYEERT